MKTKRLATAYAILAAALYAINIPLSKFMLGHVGSTMLAALLYLGAGLGMLALSAIRQYTQAAGQSEPLTRKELPYTLAMVVLDIAAPILLMLGVSKTTSANVSLLNNFEIVATSVVALTVYHEVISRRLWIAIALVAAASAILSFEGADAFAFNEGSLCVLGACVCWGFENNCTKMLSNKSSQEIVIIKGCFSGLGSLGIALALGERIPALRWFLAAMALGFVAYGLSINFYIMAQKELGAAKTSAYYSVAPFLGVAFSLLLIGERPQAQFYLALAVMAAATVLMAMDTVRLQHSHAHAHTHTHMHSHGTLCHSHAHTHTHTHLHVHGTDADDHTHRHNDYGAHTHPHTA